MKINKENIVIRASSVSGFFSCAYQWGKTYLEGIPSIPNSRAAIGTAIHAGAENVWNEAIEKKEKNLNKDAMEDAALYAWKEEKQKGLQFGDGEDDDSCTQEILNGNISFGRDIYPDVPIPKAVECYYVRGIDNHPLVTGIGGHVDYIKDPIVADLKITKKRSNGNAHAVQLGLYKYLANHNGHKIEHSLIQQIVLKRAPEGRLLKVEADVNRARYLLNTMLKALKLVWQDQQPVETVLRPNPGHLFCSERFCAHYKTCPGIHGK